MQNCEVQVALCEFVRFRIRDRNVESRFNIAADRHNPILLKNADIKVSRKQFRESTYGINPTKYADDEERYVRYDEEIRFTPIFIISG